LNQVIIYTDGACTGNPGPGGYGVIIFQDGKQRELTGGRRLTTNNRMELLAVIEALSVLKGQGDITLYTDSRYLVDALEKKWLSTWRNNNWRKSSRQKVLNKDLWQQLAELLESHPTRFIWVEGHAGNKYNERCDLLSRRAAARKDLPADPGYENPPKPASLFESF
jgi:ribonuclease HI